jgi:AraC-like DNA-binding protein
MLSNPIELSHASPPMVGGHLQTSVTEVADLSLTKPHQPIRGGLAPRALRRVREYIEAHLDETIGLETLAGIAGLSKYHFARAFKQSAGMTPHEFLVQCRVRHALKLLADTEIPLSRIAYASGFSDQSHLAHRFRERVGITPSSYRWLMR